MKRCLILLLTLSLTLALAACGAPAASQSDASASASSQGETASSAQGDTSSAQTGDAVQGETSVQSGDNAQTGVSAQSPATENFTDLTHKELVDVYDAAYAHYDQTGPTVLLLTEVTPQVGEVAFLVSFMEDTEPDRTLELVRQDGQWVVVYEG